MQPRTAIGVDIGGTKIAVGIVLVSEGLVLERRVLPGAAQRRTEEVIADVERAVLELAADTVAHSIAGIGVGVCEIVDCQGEIVSANLFKVAATDVRRRLSSVAPVVIDADVRVAARAEALFGAGKGARVFLYITIGTGIASCLVIDRQPFMGARGATGTMASGPLPGFHDAASAQLLPTLEEVASGPALVTRYRARNGAADSAQEVLKAAANGNSTAMMIVQSGAAALGATIGMLVNVLDPALVVLGGGLGLAEGMYRDALVESARRHIWWDGHRNVPIVSAATGPEAGLIGAAAAFWNPGSERT